MKKAISIVTFLFSGLFFNANAQVQLSITDFKLGHEGQTPFILYNININNYVNFSGKGFVRDSLKILIGKNKDSGEFSTESFYLQKPNKNFGREMDYIFYRATAPKTEMYLDSLNASTAKIPGRMFINGDPGAACYLSVIYKSHNGTEVKAYQATGICK
jgi:hypothetical protein